MKKVFVTCLLLACAVALPAWLYAQCSNGRCRPAAWTSPGERHEWHFRVDTPDEAYLYRGGVQIGAFHYNTGTYLPIVAGQWGAPCAPPIATPIWSRELPVQEQLDGEQGQPLGVDRGKLPEGEEFRAGTQQISYAELVRRFSEEDRLPDDSKKPHLTAITRDAQTRRQVESDLAAPALAGLAGSFRVQVYDLTTPAAKEMLKSWKLDENLHFQQSGLAVFIQPPEDAAGTAKPCALYAYQGPDDLAKQIEAVRKDDPTFDANKIRTPASGSQNGWVALAGIAALGALAWKAGKKK